MLADQIKPGCRYCLRLEHKRCKIPAVSKRQRAVEFMQCGRCGNAVAVGATFCGHCGSPVAGPPLSQQQNAPIPAPQPLPYPQQPPRQPAPISPGGGNTLKIIIFAGVGLFLLAGIGVVLFFVFSGGEDEQDNQEETATNEEEESSEVEDSDNEEEESSEVEDSETADSSEADSGDANDEPAENNDEEPDLDSNWSDDIVLAQKGLASLGFNCESLTFKESIEGEESSLYITEDNRELYERFKQASFSSERLLGCRHGEQFFNIEVMAVDTADAVFQETIDFICETGAEYGLSPAESEELFEDWGEDSPGDDAMLRVGSLVISINPYTVDSLEELLDDAGAEYERYQLPEPGC